MTDTEHFPNLRRLRKYDRELLAAALEELSRAAPARTGSSNSTRSAVYAARYGSICARCGFPITVGQDIRFRHDFGAVHDGCRPPKVTIRTISTASTPQPRSAPVMPARRPMLCPECHLEHAGGCF
jgi:hypothetical protein